MEIQRKLGDQSGIAKTLGQLASLEYRKGNYPEASKLYNQVKGTFEKLGDQNSIATTLGQLGRLAEGQKDLQKAVEYYSEAVEIFKRLGSPYAKLAEEDLNRVKALMKSTVKGQ